LEGVVPQKPALIDNRVAAAISHPTRLRAMNVLWEREASPREIAAEIGEPLNNVTYHVNQLREVGCIELVAQRPARGGRVVEHFYKAVSTSTFWDAELDQLGSDEKVTLDLAILKLIAGDLGEALLSGSFFELDDNTLVRIPMLVDADGWIEAKEILERAFDELMELRETIANRVAKSGEETVPTRINFIQFKSPRSEQPDDQAT
jgi:DNA-binding transcriptional ArsR family regulator